MTEPGVIDSAIAFAEAEKVLQAQCALNHPRLREAAALLEQDRPEAAAKLLQNHLKNRPGDPNALYLSAESALLEGKKDVAQGWLEKCIASAPDFAPARLSYAQLLQGTGRPELVLSEAETLLRQYPGNPVFRRLKAQALDEAEDFVASAACWQEMCRDYPDWPEGWLQYGHALKVLGDQQEAIAAYRKALEIDRSTAGAYWGLAAMKAFRFTDAEVEQMENLLRRSNLAAGDRVKLHFGLGQAYGDRDSYQKSFANFAKGNALHYLGIEHHPDRMTAYVARSRAVLTKPFFEQRGGFGCASTAPIFIVGMPRSGSTLVEQILASHSQIEGTKELPELLASVSEYLAGGSRGGAAFDPDILASFDAATLHALGERYLERTAPHRKSHRPFFTDKMPANFAYVGLIHLSLPNAKIVDIRRHPMACGFAIFSELFAGAQDVAYRLGDIGRAYRNYVELMTHFDEVVPEKVHRIFYERLVSDPESEIRQLFEYLELPFEPACLEFHKTTRIVTTRSSEQVRRPIYKAAVDRWRRYEEWLGPLKNALGDVLDAYPTVG